MKITLEIPLVDAMNLRDLLALIRKGDPSTAALVTELERHEVDLSKVKIS